MNNVENKIANDQPVRHWIKGNAKSAVNLLNDCKKGNVNPRWFEYIYPLRGEKTTKEIEIIFFDKNDLKNKFESTVRNSEIFMLKNTDPKAVGMGLDRISLFSFIYQVCQVNPMAIQQWFGIDIEKLKIQHCTSKNGVLSSQIVVIGDYEEFKAFKAKMLSVSKLFGSVDRFISLSIKRYHDIKGGNGNIYIELFQNFIYGVAKNEDMVKYSIFDMLLILNKDFSQENVEKIIGNYAVDIYDLTTSLFDYIDVFGSFRLTYGQKLDNQAHCIC